MWIFLCMQSVYRMFQIISTAMLKYTTWLFSFIFFVDASYYDASGLPSRLFLDISSGGFADTVNPLVLSLLLLFSLYDQLK